MIRQIFIIVRLLEVRISKIFVILNKYLSAPLVFLLEKIIVCSIPKFQSIIFVFLFSIWAASCLKYQQIYWSGQIHRLYFWFSAYYSELIDASLNNLSKIFTFVCHLNKPLPFNIKTRHHFLLGHSFKHFSKTIF